MGGKPKSEKSQMKERKDGLLGEGSEEPPREKRDSIGTKKQEMQ